MTWIVAPEHGEARVGVVRCGDPAAEGQGVGEVLVPIAQLAGSAEVGAAEAPDEAFEPGPGVRDRAGAGRGHGEGYGLRPIARCDQIGRASCRESVCQSV